jgi:hypothetical protein
MKFKSRFKLEFDIKTNSDNMEQILNIITSNIQKEFEENIKDKTEVEIYPTITKIDMEEK